MTVVAKDRTTPGGLGLVGDFVGLIGLALLVPIAILAFGLPFVLLIRALLWLVAAF